MNFSSQGATIILNDKTEYDLYATYLSFGAVNKFKVYHKLHIVIGGLWTVRLSKNEARPTLLWADFLYTRFGANLVSGVIYDVSDSISLEGRFVHGLFRSVRLRYFRDNYPNEYVNSKMFQFGMVYRFKL